MCSRCDDIDKKIEHYRLILKQVMDRDFSDGAKALIVELEAEKSSLHPLIE